MADEFQQRKRARNAARMRNQRAALPDEVRDAINADRRERSREIRASLPFLRMDSTY